MTSVVNFSDSRKPLWVKWATSDSVLFLGPTLIMLLSVTVFPFVYLLYRSFFFDNLMNPTATHFIGLSNYITLLTDPDVLHAFLNTFVFALCSVFVEMVLGMLLALLLNSELPGMNLVTVLIIVPMSFTPIVGAITWKYLISPPFGWFDYYLQKFGFITGSPDLLSHGVSAMATLILFNVWTSTPFVALILLAGLKSQPAEPLEAASIDGANSYRKFLSIQLPFLKRFIFIAGVLKLIAAFKSFSGVFGLTGGGPGRSTELMSLVVYRDALQSFQVGYAAAIAFVFLIVLLILTTPLINKLQNEIMAN